jgi:hypothetical protein
MREAFLFGRVFWLQPDQIEERRQRKDGLHHTVWSVLLPSNAVRPKKIQEQLING